MEIELRINKNYTIQRSLRKQIIINNKQCNVNSLKLLSRFFNQTQFRNGSS